MAELAGVPGVDRAAVVQVASSTPHHDAIIIMMRTTLTLPDDVYDVAKDFAHQRRISLGDAVAELVRRALRPAPAINTSTPFPCFQMDPDSRPITLEETLAAEEDL